MDIKVIINVEQSPKGAKLIPQAGVPVYLQQVKRIEAGPEVITIWDPQIGRSYQIRYSEPDLDKYTSSTPEELVDYWLANNFFFDVGVNLPLNPPNNYLATYRAQNFTDLTTNVATSPSEGETAYVINPQGTSWLPGSLGGSYYPRGLYYYDGAQWISDKQEVAQQLQINIDDIDAIEAQNLAQDSAISNNTSLIVANASSITDLQNDKADKSITITGQNSVSGGGDLSSNRVLELLNDEAAPASKVYGFLLGAKGFFFINEIVSNNTGVIKLNWTNLNRPETTQGFTAGVVKTLSLNQNYTVSSSPTTTYPFLANPAIGGQNVIDLTTLFLRELLAGQAIIFRVKAGYLNKVAGQNGKITLQIFNPNPASGFRQFKAFPAPDGTTEFEQEFQFYAIADGLSLDSLWGYAFEADSTFSDGNLIVYIQEITAFYMAVENFNK